mmetsp:Transcript_31953/g.57226  ORF Transcript_31953/g.57226 Transcript_31953/m.57226 type:complete len:219 (+) Transcript_31953:1356-2012(+)
MLLQGLNCVRQRYIHHHIHHFNRIARNCLTSCHALLDFHTVHNMGGLQPQGDVVAHIHSQDVRDLERRREEEVIEGHSCRPEFQTNLPKINNVALHVLYSLRHGAALQQRHHERVHGGKPKAANSTVQDHELDEVPALAGRECLIQGAVKNVDKRSLHKAAVNYYAKKRLRVQFWLTHNCQLSNALGDRHSQCRHHSRRDHGKLLREGAVRADDGTQN